MTKGRLKQLSPREKEFQSARVILEAVVLQLNLSNLIVCLRSQGSFSFNTLAAVEIQFSYDLGIGFLP